MTTLREDFKQGTTTDSPLGAAATTINSAEFADLMAVTGGSGNFAKLILDPAGVNGDPEIVYVTSHTAGTTAVTVTRGREGTVAREHPSPTTWKHGPTSQDFGLDIGDGKIHFGATAPQGWVFCRGQELSRTTYAKLYEVIGDTFGNGDGSTTFNVPDMQGIFPVGASGTPGDYDLGDTGGEETHTLTAAETPAHDHSGTSTQAAHSHGDGSLSASSAGGHNHVVPVMRATNVDHTHINNGYGAGAPSPDSGNHSVTTASGDGAHTHTVTGTTATAGSHSHTLTSVGSGNAHENRPPFLAVNYCIFTGVY